MADESVRRARAERSVRDPHALHVPPGHPYSPIPSAELRARLDHALALWRRGAAPLIVVSGGVDEGLDEVTAMTAYLVGRGVPAVAVVPARPARIQSWRVPPSSSCSPSRPSP